MRKNKTFSTIEEGLDYLRSKTDTNFKFEPKKTLLQNESTKPKKANRQRVHCVYQIVCKTNDKVYVGSTVDFDKRMSIHKRKLLRGDHHSREMQCDYNKYGLDNFLFEPVKIIKHLPTREELLCEEEHIISSIKKDCIYNKMAKIILYTDISKVDALLSELKKHPMIGDFRIWNNN